MSRNHSRREPTAANVVDCTDLRERSHVFRDRSHAGQILAGLLEDYAIDDALLLAIPAGGVPVAAAMAKRLSLEMDIAVVSKITPSWNTEVGYGAVAFDGSVRINEAMMARLGINEAEKDAGIAATRAKVTRRIEKLRKGREPLKLSGCRVIRVDDGLASGITLQAAVAAVTKLGASAVIVSVPTGHAHSVAALASEVDAVYCANIRSGFSFAVADAYELWTDLKEPEIIRVLESVRD
jgi:predicted phosphoribosyltransferase